jgi:hypothetical protein
MAQEQLLFYPKFATNFVKVVQHAKSLNIIFESVKHTDSYGQTGIKLGQIGIWPKHEYRP